MTGPPEVGAIHVHCVAYVISPIHVLSVLSAVRTRHGEGGARITLLSQWPGLDESSGRDLADVIRTLTRSSPEIDRVVLLQQQEMTAILESRSPSAAARRFRAWLADGADEIYYPHDVVGQVWQLMALAFSRAARICFGDAMGQVFERDVHLGLLGIAPVPRQPSRHGLKEAVALVRRALTRPPGKRQPLQLPDARPHEAVLILPVDQSGRFLDGIPLTVCPAEVVRGVLEECRSASVELNRYIDDTLALYENRPRLLLLTENWAEGNFISFDAEVDLYARFAEAHCPDGGVVIVKPHPGETLPRGEALRSRLEPRLRVVETEARFRRYPIELWVRMVRECRILSTAYPVLSLKYLYNIDVIQPMDESVIERSFPDWVKTSLKNTTALNMKPLARLAQWDGKSVLWSPQVS